MALTYGQGSLASLGKEINKLGYTNPYQARAGLFAREGFQQARNFMQGFLPKNKAYQGAVRGISRFAMKNPLLVAGGLALAAPAVVGAMSPWGSASGSHGRALVGGAMGGAGGWFARKVASKSKYSSNKWMAVGAASGALIGAALFSNRPM